MVLRGYDLNADWFLFEGEGENVTATLKDIREAKRFTPDQRSAMLAALADKKIDVKAIEAKLAADLKAKEAKDAPADGPSA